MYRVALPALVPLLILSLFSGVSVASGNAGCANLSIEVPASSECESEIAAHPTPNVFPVTPDTRALSRYRFMRLVNGANQAEAVTVYDAPDGEAIKGIDPGFNFVTTLQQAGDWYEINPGEWVHSRDLVTEAASRFAGVEIIEPLVYPVAWILVNTYTAEYPGGPQIIDADRLHFRYERVNIYSAVQVDGRDWYLIAPGEWVFQNWVGIGHSVSRPEGIGGRWVAVDLDEQTLVAYEDDRMVFATLVSSGLPDWGTREGIFSIWARFESDHMSGAEGRKDFYYLENVPYTMYFDGEIGLHGTYWHDGFGYRHSHGCVNLSITDAKWLFDWTSPEPYREASVYVYSSGQY